jgi:energy-coupling factor transporter ATP-binding protein EcfA2
MEPDMLILDEPTVGLDQESEGIILDILADFQGAILCVSHDLFFLYSLCQRALVLKDGLVHHDYTMTELVSEKATLREHGLDFTFRFRCCADDSGSPKSHDNDFLKKDTPESAVVELQDYSYRYADGTPALKNITFKIEKGERIALIGENGAGKSTLALCLMGILKGSGIYRFYGEKVSESKRKGLWQRVGLMFQNSMDQFFTSSCFEEIAFALKRMKLKDGEIESRVRWALDSVRLRGYEDRVPHHLSGGEQKRLALATILAMQPDLIILDEPTNNLDPEGEQTLIEILDQIESTLIVISHDICFLSFLCDRVIILNKGLVEADMTFEAFMANEQASIRHHHEHEYRKRCCHAIRELFYS